MPVPDALEPVEAGRLIIHDQPTVVMGRSRISGYPYTAWFELISRDGVAVSVYPVGDWAPKLAALVEAGFTCKSESG